MSTITSNAGALAIFSDSFTKFDMASERAQTDAGMVTSDGLVSADDLRAVAYDTTGLYTPEEQAAAKHLLDHPELWRMLDTANTDAPTDDGLVSQKDIDAAADSPLLETPNAVAYSGSADPYADSLQTLQNEFGVFDAAGDGGKQDGQVSMHDLITIAYGEQGDYSIEQRAAARYLLDHIEIFDAMDADGDGLISINDVQTQAAAPAPPNANQTQPASLNTNGDGELSDAEIQAGAEANAPVLYFDPDDGFLLTDPEAYIEGSYVTDENGNYIANPREYMQTHPGKPLIIDPGMYVIDDMSQYAGSGIFVTAGAPQTLVEDPQQYLADNPGAVLAVIPQGQVIDNPAQIGEGGHYYTPDGVPIDDPTKHLNENPGATLYWNPGDTANRTPDATKTYYEYDPESNTITYYYFYPNNDGPAGGTGDLQNHEGDWEKVTIKLDDQYRPNTVSYSAHGGGSEIPWSQAIKEDGRPVVFVARGSHANYFVPGDDYHTVGNVADDQTVGSTAEGLRWDTRQTSLVRVREDDPLWWQHDNVFWGERRIHKDLSGPKSPFGIPPPTEKE